jgi:hypothetical protein
VSLLSITITEVNDLTHATLRYAGHPMAAGVDCSAPGACHDLAGLLELRIFGIAHGRSNAAHLPLLLEAVELTRLAKAEAESAERTAMGVDADA